MSPNGDIEQAKQQFHSAPVVDVTKCNISTLEPTIRLAIQNCDFVAIDCELSGLGDRKNLNNPSIEDRFANASIVTKTRSIIALGLSIFKEILQAFFVTVAYLIRIPKLKLHVSVSKRNSWRESVPKANNWEISTKLKP